jgi:hypothetical protein
MQMRGSWTKAIQRWSAVAVLVLSALPGGPERRRAASGHGARRAGAAIPGATATLTSNTRGTVLSAVVNRTGDFVFATVPPDTYALAVKADGFKGVERKNVVVNANDKLSVGTLTLTLGGVSETIAPRRSDPAADPERRALLRRRGPGHPERRHQRPRLLRFRVSWPPASS